MLRNLVAICMASFISSVVGLIVLLAYVHESLLPQKSYAVVAMAVSGEVVRRLHLCSTLFVRPAQSWFEVKNSNRSVLHMHKRVEDPDPYCELFTRPPPLC